MRLYVVDQFHYDSYVSDIQYRSGPIEQQD